MNTKLHTTVMRRVYYAFVIRAVTHQATLYAVACVALVWWLKELVFFARIWQSFISTPVGDLGSFMYGLITGADPLTLGVTTLFVWCVYRLLRWRPEWYRTVSYV